jgi:hypothetical protein
MANCKFNHPCMWRVQMITKQFLKANKIFNLQYAIELNIAH